MSDAKIGHNSNLSADEKLKLGGYVREVERLNEEIGVLTGDRSEIYKSAKDAGFDTAAIRQVIKNRKTELDKREAFEAAVDAYTVALGDFVTTGLGAAAATRAGQDAAYGKKRHNGKPPVATLPAVDTSNAPFHAPPDDEPRTADPGIPEFLDRRPQA